MFPVKFVHQKIRAYTLKDKLGIITFMETLPPLKGRLFAKYLPLKQDIHGLRHLLHIIEKDSVLTQQRKAAISVDILAALPAAVETFSGYYSPGNLWPENNTLYDDFVMYVQITRLTHGTKDRLWDRLVGNIRQVQRSN